MNIKEAISLIARFETLHPELTTSQIVDSLRKAGDYDKHQFRVILGTTKLNTFDITASKKLTLNEKTLLKGIMSHHAETGAKTEKGVTFDLCTPPRRVALGHVICGISGGIHHPGPVYCKTEVVKNVGPKEVCYDTNDGKARELFELDVLYAMTITGDIGQQAVKANYYLCSQDARKRWDWGGIGSAAGEAELIGDIDGFMLGYWLSTNKVVANPKGVEGYRTRMLKYNQLSPQKVKLSDLLSKYYQVTSTNNMIAGSGRPLDAQRRFFNFQLTFKTLNDSVNDRYNFLQQSINFNFVYAPTLREWPDPDQTVKAYEDFEKWVKNDGNYNFYQYAASEDDSSSSNIALDNIDDTEDLAYRVTMTKVDEDTGVEQEQLTYLFDSIDTMGLTNPDLETIALFDSDDSIVYA